MLAAHDAQASLLNWRKAGAASTIGAPVFVADRGWFCDGADDAVLWNWRPADGSSFTQDSGMIGAWFRKGDRNANAPVGTQTGSSCTLNPRSSSDALAGRLNSVAVTSGGAVSRGYGLAAIDRSAASAVRMYQGGVAVGNVSAVASSARANETVASGKANGLFADGQFCAHVAGASLTATEHAALQAALGAYMDAVGVAAIVPAQRSLPLAVAVPLPDGAHPVAPGAGMDATGLAHDPIDDSWWVGNGVASAQAHAGVTCLSPDLTTIISEHTVAGWGLPTNRNGSVQGVAFDGSDQTLWLVLKATSTGSVLLHVARDGGLIGAPAGLPYAGCNGIAYHPGRDLLLILVEGSPSTVRWFTKGGADLSSSNQVLTLPGVTADHLWCDPVGGELLVTWGDNGPSGVVGRFAANDYGGWYLVGQDTLAGADAIEGVVRLDGQYHVVNDAATHAGDPPANRVLRYNA